VHNGIKSKFRKQSEVVDLVTVLFLVLPKSQVFLEELDDALGVTEVVFLELVDLVEGILEGLVGKLTGSLVVLEDLVMEDGEVEGETELDGVARGEGDLVSFGVSLESRLLDLFHEGTLGVLGDVAEVVADHLDEECLGLTVAGLGEDLGVDEVDDALAVSGELVLDGTLVAGECGSVLGILGVLLNGGNSAASGALGTDEVLKGDG
jgi:hypothetical protein